MNKRTVALLPTDVRDPALTAPFLNAYQAEQRPHGDASRVSSVPVARDGTYTLACTGSYALSVAFVKAVLP